MAGWRVLTRSPSISWRAGYVDLSRIGQAGLAQRSRRATAGDQLSAQGRQSAPQINNPRLVEYRKYGSLSPIGSLSR